MNTLSDWQTRFCFTIFALSLALGTRNAGAQTPATPPATVGNPAATVEVTGSPPPAPPAPPAAAPMPGNGPPGTYAYAYAQQQPIMLFPGMRWRSGYAAPPGWHVQREASPGMLVGGGLLFALPWALTAYVAFQTPGIEWMAIPVIGPVVGGVYLFVVAGTAAGSGCTYLCPLGVAIAGVFGVVLIVDGLAQAAGLAMAAVGAFRGRLVIEPDQRARMPRPQGLRWSLLPVAPGAQIGASLSIVGF